MSERLLYRYDSASGSITIEPSSMDWKIVFKKNGWNDYGYNLMFDVVYYTNDGEGSSVGSFRVYHTKMEEIHIDKGDISIHYYIKNFFKDGFPLSLINDEDYIYSIAPTIEFYINLYKYVGEYFYHEILSKFQDLSIVEKSIDTIEENVAVENGLFRNRLSKYLFKLSKLLRSIEKSATLGNFFSNSDFLKKLLEDDRIKDYLKEIDNVLEYDFDDSLSITFYTKLIDSYTNNKSGFDLDSTYHTLSEYLNKLNYTQLLSKLEKSVDQSLSLIHLNVTNILNQLLFNFSKENNADAEFSHYTALGSLEYLVYKESKKSI